MNEKAFKKILITLGAIIVIMLAVVIFLVNGRDNESGKSQTEAMSGQHRDTNSPPPSVEPQVAKEVAAGKDPIRIVDSPTLSKINDFLNRFSNIISNGLIEDYLQLFTDPVIVAGKRISRETFRKQSGEYFMDNQTVKHYFENTKAFASSEREYIVYTKQYYDFMNVETNKFSSVVAYKKFTLIDMRGELICKEVETLSRERK